MTKKKKTANKDLKMSNKAAKRVRGGQSGEFDQSGKWEQIGKWETTWKKTTP